jgi:hypothetical protein
MATLMPLVGAGDGPVDELGSLNEQPDHSAKQIGDYYREALLLKLFDQAARATVNLPGGAFTGCVVYCRVDRDSVHMQHCRVDRDRVHMQRCCHRMRVHSIALPLLHRRQGRPWDLPRR